MAIVEAAVIVPLGLLFFVPGLVVNLIQAACFVLIRPLSKNTYRKINRVVAELLWLELVWLVDWWAGVKIKVFTDHESFSLMGKEHALVVANHRSDIDWVVGWVLAQRYGCLGTTIAVMKKPSKLLPAGLQRLKDFPYPFWLALFVEGTRFTQAKLVAAQEYAALRGLPIPRNVLVPRTKGFVSAVSHMRSFVPAIYDMTLAIPKTTTSPSPTLLGLFKGQSFVVNVHIKRRLMKELRDTDEAVARWCKDMFVEKDKLLDKHIAEDTFSDQPIILQDIGRPIKSLLVVTLWSCLVVYGIVKFLQWSSLLSSWKGIALSAFGLAIVTILMKILIFFSLLERSSPAKIAPRKPKNDEEISEVSQQ
ncbi:hypothetical protein PTKIN_Ptkin14bG0229400 [Pterospermum kingtungense]